ncbi:MAG: tRNA 4-thiouridine(8) synthase ThiI [Myxococcales bacterium]|nr:tRNA 4-thiouridine(8) synthase ThiI [Myxococcales bacterium]
MTPKPNAMLCRYGEVFLKKGRKLHFVEEVRKNVASCLRMFHNISVTAPYGRIVVLNGDGYLPNLPAFAENQPAVEEAIRRVFGIENFSPAILCTRDFGSIRDAAIALVDERRRSTRLPLSFKAETNRVDKTFPVRSRQLNADIGAAILQHAPDMSVNVHHPDLLIEVEIRPEFVLVSAGRIEGAHGLPAGTSGRGLLLLSGGIDSPVAGWLAIKRGVAVEALYFHSFPFTGDQARRKVIELGRALAKWQSPFLLHIVQFAEYQKFCRDKLRGKLLVLAYRRQMLRVAEALAKRRGLTALITGESIGQVASQTLENMATIESAATLPVLRPVCSYDKMETVVLANRIGTYDISIQPYDDCCSLFVPEHPELHGRTQRMEWLESTMEVDKHVDLILDTLETLPLTSR